MGKAYHVRCETCRWNDVFYLGKGKNDREKQANEALHYLMESNLREEIDLFIHSQTSIAMTMERHLYVCQHCKRLQVRLQIHLRSDTALFCPAYYCDKCGKILKKIRENMIKKQLCPICMGHIIVDRVTNWDIAPNAEAAIRIKT